MKTITVTGVEKQLEEHSPSTIFIDVRTEREYDHEHIDGFINIPLSQLPTHFEELKNKKIVFSCFSGSRAQKAAQLVAEKIPSATVVCFRGSLRAWENEGKATENDEKMFFLSLQQQTFLLLGSLLIFSTFISLGDYIVWIVGGGLFFAGITGTCMLQKMIGYMPWNK